jgi:Flp pilus assembly protein TadB
MTTPGAAQLDDIRRAVERRAAASRRLLPWLLLSLALFATLVGARRGLGGHLGAIDLAAALVIASGPLWAGYKSRQRARYLATLSTPEEFLDYYRAQQQEEASDAQRLLWLLLLPLGLFVLPVTLLLPRLGHGGRNLRLLAAVALVVVALVVWLVRRIRRARRVLATLPPHANQI